MRSAFWGVDPVAIEIDVLKSKLVEARMSGDRATEALILQNLRSFGYKATG